MSTQRPKKPVGKPTNTNETRENADHQRDEPKPETRGKPTLEPGTRDAQIGQRGVITDDNEVD
jgi:hypothetical protein